MSEFAENPPDPLQRESLEWLVRLTSGRVSVADAEGLAAWKAQSPAHLAAFEDALRLRRLLQRAGTEYLAHPPHSVPVGLGSPRGPRISRRAWLGGAVAASVAGLMVVHPPFALWPALSELTADYRTAKGEQRQVQLAEGLSVTLNTQTALSAAARQGSAMVELISGEASFHADLAGHLIVSAGRSTVTASHADFNIRHDEAASAITCLSGRLDIRREGGQLALAAGQQLTYRAGEAGVVTAADQPAALAWRKGLLVFHDMPFQQMVHEINRYRPGMVMLANGALAQKRFSGVFHIGRLDGAMAAIEKLGVHVTRLPGDLVLLS